MRTIGLPGVSYGGVSRREGWSAPGRSEYQMGLERRGGVAGAKRRSGNPVTHMRHWLLLPKGVDPAIWMRDIIWTAAGKAETRKDAREARFFDISWPRELPTAFIEGFVAELYAPLVAMGLAVQVDWETSPADDGLPNDHLHGLISTRALSNDGFSGGKCRELDSWFRCNVRRIVAGLFDAIAQRQDIAVRFDPRPNVEREDALPAEDVLPRGIVRNRQAAGAAKMLDRRDAQRRLRREHDEIKLRIETLQDEKQNLLSELESDLAELTVLNSSQGDGSEPLAAETAITLLMGRGVAVDRYIPLGDLGLALVVDGAIIVDQGMRILVEDPITEEVARAMHALARGKGWRDMSLTDSIGMPMPVPADPAHRPVQKAGGSMKWSRLARLGKHHVVQAATEVVQKLQTAPLPERQAMLDRTVRWGNPCLVRLVAKLVAYADRQSPIPAIGEDLVLMMEQAMGTDVGLWAIYSLEQDVVAMTTPGNPLSRPFRPHPRFYEYYSQPDGLDHARTTGDQDGASQ
jgi:hypothetical protein